MLPGQKEEWTLNVCYPDGKPAKAQLMATLYDKSLDQIAEHLWDFSSSYTNNLPAYIEWSSFNFPILDFYEVANYKSLTESSLSLARFDARFVNGLSFNQLFIRGNATR